MQNCSKLFFFKFSNPKISKTEIEKVPVFVNLELKCPINQLNKD